MLHRSGEDSGVGDTATTHTGYRIRGIGGGSPTVDEVHQNPRWQDMGYPVSSMAYSCPTSAYEVNAQADKDICGTSCGDGWNQGSVGVSVARSGCYIGDNAAACGTRLMTFGLDVTKPANDGTNSYWRGQGPVTFKIVEAPAPSNVGPVSTGGGSGGTASGMGFVVVRRASQPTVLFPLPGQAGVATGDEMVGTPTSAAYTSLGVAGPTLVVTTSDGNVNVFKGAERSAARVMTQVTDSRGGAQDSLLCNLHGASDGSFELVIAGDGTSPRVYSASNDGAWTEGSSVQLDDSANRDTANPRPYSVSVTCSDLNNDGLQVLAAPIHYPTPDFLHLLTIVPYFESNLRISSFTGPQKMPPRVPIVAPS